MVAILKAYTLRNAKRKRDQRHTRQLIEFFQTTLSVVRKDDVGRITDFGRMFLTEPNFEYAKKVFRNRAERRIADKLEEIEELKAELKIINESEE